MYQNEAAKIASEIDIIIEKLKIIITIFFILN
jgi:hypothetical protein